MMSYKTLVGVEIHVELSTKTKIFCGCTNEFGGDANSHCCPVCLGLPGSIPTLNKNVVEYAAKAGLAFNCDISQNTKMDRKNYFYSDLVKGFQVSQDDIPLCKDGYIEINANGEDKKIRIERIHIEEDTGKSIHTETNDTLLDYNRAGVPLIEIVSKPDLSSGEETRIFLENLRETLKYLNVSDVKMEEGSLRCDVNINVVNTETNEKTSITEVKNLNSFRAVEKSIEYEEKRHIKALEEGHDIEKDTRRWDDINNETIVMRTKGSASDYRFALDGNIPPIEISDQWLDGIKDSMPELPGAKRERFISEYKIPEYDAEVITQNKELADFFEEVIKDINEPELVSNWIMGDVLRRLNDDNKAVKDLLFSPSDLAELLNLIKNGKINNNIGKKVFRTMFETGKKPEVIVKEEGLIQISDEGEIEKIVVEVVNNNEQSVLDYKAGKDRALGFLMGQVMKASKGKANPQLASKLVKEELDRR